ncbi:acetone carboxylase subunit gamma [Saccharolobus caldissimus]|uniref:Acetone carboxylase subunit gamma n=1 Tax=Saccharolobus caldissimus TaxID=1702097 RepID=A0AAQ4CRH7_9CREN|nr:acetone carboxylase subunit gamma [Saccharolobus caldissimus]BDB98408.1 hypothetical protein SACC_14250 [Saccharolobus caldissimus]
MNEEEKVKRVEQRIQLLERLLQAKSPIDEVFRVIAGDKEDPEIAFDAIIEYFQRKVNWKEKILLPINDHLFIVCKDGKPIVKAACGYEFGDFRVNWKVFCKIRVRRNTEDYLEIYPWWQHAHPYFMELREYYCPGCYKLLATEAVPIGHPVVFEFLPDIVTFYEKWLKRPFPCGKVEFKDLTNEYIKNSIKI